MCDNVPSPLSNCRGCHMSHGLNVRRNYHLAKYLKRFATFLRSLNDGPELVAHTWLFVRECWIDAIQLVEKLASSVRLDVTGWWYSLYHFIIINWIWSSQEAAREVRSCEVTNSLGNWSSHVWTVWKGSSSRMKHLCKPHVSFDSQSRGLLLTHQSFILQRNGRYNFLC